MSVITTTNEFKFSYETNENHSKVKYTKNKGELISISSDQELHNALEDNREIGQKPRFLIFQRRDEEGPGNSVRRHNRLLALQEDGKTKKRPASLHILHTISEQPTDAQFPTTKHFTGFALLDLQTEEGIILRKRANEVRERSATTSLT